MSAHGLALISLKIQPPLNSARSFETRRRAKEKGKRSDEPWRKRIAANRLATTTASMVQLNAVYTYETMEKSGKRKTDCNKISNVFNRNMFNKKKS